MSVAAHLKPVAAFVALALIWGTTWGVIKIGLRSLPPLLFAAGRMLLAALLLIVLMRLLRVPWPRARRTYGALMVVGALLATSFGAVFWSEQYVSSGLTAVLTSTSPLWTAGVAHLALRNERMTLGKMLALAIGVAGTAILFGGRVRVAGTLGSLAVAVLALVPILWALASVTVKRELAGVPTITVTALQMLFGSAVLLIVALPLEAGRPITWDAGGLFALLYMAVVGSCMAFFLLFWLIQHVRVTTSSLFSLVTPAEAILFGAVVLRERLSLAQALGFVVITLGLLLYLFNLRREQARAAPLAA
jgi:drug/metabolite transporter (DMT)-like permease